MYLQEAVVLEDLTEHQLVGVQGEGVPEHLYGDQVHVTVGALRLGRTGAIKHPLRNICQQNELSAKQIQYITALCIF